LQKYAYFTDFRHIWSKIIGFNSHPTPFLTIINAYK
jgi:hypothetical protein